MEATVFASGSSSLGVWHSAWNGEARWYEQLQRLEIRNEYVPYPEDLWGCVELTETEGKSKGQEPRSCLTVKQMHTRIYSQLHLPRKCGTV